MRTYSSEGSALDRRSTGVEVDVEEAAVTGRLRALDVSRAWLALRGKRREDAPVDRPVTHYARTEDDVHIAYQVLGNGPIDVVFVHAFVSHVELFWELPSYARFIRELSLWGRAIMFDKRGVGLSDRLSVVPTLEARIDDLRAVLDAVESERTLVVGNSDGGALAAMFAATYPERTLGLVLWSGGVRMAWAPDYPWGMREEPFEERLSTRMELWGDEERGEETVRMTFETSERLAKDPAFVEWLPRLQRNSAAPGDLVRFSRVWFSTDARSALPAIQVPTAVFMREGWATDPVEEARWTADQIPGARLVSLSGDEDDVIPRRRGRGRGSCSTVRRVDRGGTRGLRPGARDGSLHRHRRIVGAGGGARRPGVERIGPEPSREGAGAARPLPRARGRHGRRRVLRHVRRTRASGALRRGDRPVRGHARGRGPRRSAHR